MTQPSETAATHVPFVLRVVLSRPVFWGSLLLGLVVGWIVQFGVRRNATTNTPPDEAGA